MMLLLASIYFVSSLIIPHVVGQVPPMFVLTCNDYPDVCDNHCNAITCHDMNGIHLHYDATSDVGTADQRRTAIGCGSNNYCPSGTDCDEFPYASTYDGGLGCYPDGYDGGESLQQSGTTRCVDPSQNSRHGSALGRFYSDKNLQNGDVFTTDWVVLVMCSFVGVTQSSPLCDALSTQGDLACPDESTGPYRFRSTPATPACPARGPSRRDVISGLHTREAGKKLVRTMVTENGMRIRVVGRAGESESDPGVGTPVFSVGVDGKEIRDVIVNVE